MSHSVHHLQVQDLPNIHQSEFIGSQIAWPTLSSNILAISILQIKSIEKNAR